MKTARTKIFLSFAEADRKWLERLRVHLAPLERQGLLDIWDNTRVLPGRNWRQELSVALSQTRVAVLLLSADFLASDFIMKEELPPLWTAALKGQVDLLPILIRPCLVELMSELRDYKPVRSEPLAGMSATAAEQVLGDTARSIQALLGQPSAPAAATPPSLPRVRQKRCAVLLTALRVEYLAAREHLRELHEMVHPSGTIYEQGTFGSGESSWSVALVEIGAGNSRAALEAERAMQHLSPQLMLFVGVASGRGDLAIGDVVVATKVYGYESGKVADQFQPRPSVGETSYALVQRALAEARRPDWLRRLSPPPQSPPQVVVAPIAAGEKVIASRSSELFGFLRTHYEDAVAVEMEGRGFLDAAHASQQVQALIIRGIASLIDKKQPADPIGSQEVAARHASAFAFQVIDRSGGA